MAHTTTPTIIYQIKEPVFPFMVTLEIDALPHCRIVGAFKNGFILVEQGDDGRVYVIDQHAADERVQLERVCGERGVGVLEASEEDKMVACMSAVKVTEPTSINVIERIIRSLSECQFPFICAHGRPTIIPLTD